VPSNSPRTYNVVTFFCGSGYKTLGLLRARSRAGSRFISVLAVDIDPLACVDFELLTGAMAQIVDLGIIKPWELAKRCEAPPDFVVMSPPCKGFSGCLPESLSKSEKYEALNRLAYRAVKLAIKSWPASPPKVILLENVPRMISRGKKWLDKITRLLRSNGYELSLEPHDCGEWGGLAQRRARLLLVARLRSACPSHLLRPPNLGLRPMADVLWQLPPPLPGASAVGGGPHHMLPKINKLNWLRLATIPAGQDWRAIPERVHLVDVDPRLPEDGRRHAGKYGPQDPSRPSHAVIAEARTGKGWADIADPRMGGDPKNRQTGFYGVCSSNGPSHTVIAHARAGNNGWASVSDPRLAERAARQNGGFGVNDSGRPSHGIVGEGSVRNTWSSVSDPRLGCSPRSGTMGVGDPDEPARTVIGSADVHNSSAAIADLRVGEQNRGNFGVQDPAKPSATIRAQHPARTAPSTVADDRELFRPTHQLVAGQRWAGERDAWVRGDFWLVGPPEKFTKGARGSYLIIRAPDGTVHRPMTTAELMMLQGGPVWHRPGDPAELEIGDPSGQWVQMAGPDALVREHVGNAVPPATAQAFGEVILELLDLAGKEVFALSSGGIWVERARALAMVHTGPPIRELARRRPDIDRDPVP